MNNKRQFALLIIVLALMGFSNAVPAQTLPSLPVDSRITKGTLPSGVSYYMVKNDSEKGYADIAVIQRDQPLSSSPISLEDGEFLARMGVGPSREGYISDEDGSTVFHFRDVPFYRQEVLDSMLLYSFAQIAASRAEQAIVVSGDIEPAEIKKKMDIFSMLVPKMLVKSNHVPDYVWEPSPAPWVEVGNPRAPVAGVSVTYAGARIPFEHMNTAQAIVTDFFGREIGEIAAHRLEMNLREARIPHGEIEFSSLRSADYGGDERYTVSVTVDSKDADPAMQVIARTLAELDTKGASAPEFADAKRVIGPKISAEAAATPSRASDIARCTANFLYGANLAPASESLRYFSRKNVADTTETRFFNQFSGALLTQLENLSLEFSGVPDTLDKDAALFYYNLAYLMGSVELRNKDYSWSRADTTVLDLKAPRLKIKSEKAEPISGGTLWTFSNGMRVVFRPVEGGGVFNYSLQLNGGLPFVAGLSEGEGGYIADMLSLYDVGKIPAPSFRDFLAGSGISLRTDVGVSGMTISGSAPSARLELLLKALVALTTNGTPNYSDFLSYSANEALVAPSVRDLMYQRLASGFVFSEHKLPGKLRPDTQKKAQKYFQDRFARMHDGILIISGDLKEDNVKKILLRCLGGFVTEKNPVSRKALSLNPLQGTVTTRLEGYPRGLYVLMDGDYTLTGEHYYTAEMAAYALRQELIKQLAPCGYTAEVVTSHSAQPQERFQLFISCFPAAAAGLPGGREPVDPDTVLSVLRNAIAGCAASAPSAADVNAWRTLLKDRAGRSLSTPGGICDALTERYSANKDIVSRAAATIQLITADKIQAFLTTLSGGGRIEFIAE